MHVLTIKYSRVALALSINKDKVVVYALLNIPHINQVQVHGPISI